MHSRRRDSHGGAKKKVRLGSNKNGVHTNRPDPTRPDPTRPDPTRPDPTRPDPTRPDPTRPDPTRPNPTRPNPTRHDPTRHDPTQLSLVFHSTAAIAPCTICSVLVYERLGKVSDNNSKLNMSSS